MVWPPSGFSLGGTSGREAVSGAGEGNRTLVSTLGRSRSAIEPHPRWQRTFIVSSANSAFEVGHADPKGTFSHPRASRRNHAEQLEHAHRHHRPGLPYQP